MSEPESLATVESLARRLHRHRFDRLVMLSDGIFAISTTLAALEIKLPERAPDLATVFRQSGREVGIYFISFGIIAALWFSNRELFARLKRVDPVVTMLTLILLCMTALIPAVTHRMRGTPDGDYSAYMLLMGICGSLNSGLWLHAARREGLMLDEVSRNERWRRALATLGLPLITLPFLLLPAGMQTYALGPLLAAIAVLRRKLLPRWFPDSAASQST